MYPYDQAFKAPPSAQTVPPDFSSVTLNLVLKLQSQLKGQVCAVVFTSQKAMSTFGYRRELSKYEDLDEDELLASLTAEELQELEKELTDIEPDDKVPIGLRQRDQTVKTPTGTFSREALLKYWEKETRQILENERMGSSSPQVSNSEKTIHLTDHLLNRLY